MCVPAQLVLAMSHEIGMLNVEVCEQALHSLTIILLRTIQVCIIQYTL